jgi:hypothetical protein
MDENGHCYPSQVTLAKVYVVKACGTARAFFVERVSTPLCG